MSVETLENVPGLILDGASTYPEFAEKPEKFQSSYWITTSLSN